MRPDATSRTPRTGVDGPDERLLDPRRGQRRVEREHESRDAGHDRRGERSAADRPVAVAECGRDVLPGGRDVDPTAEVRVGVQLVPLVRRSDRDYPLGCRRVLRTIAAVVPSCSDDDGPTGAGICRGGRVRARSGGPCEADVENARAVVSGPTHTSSHVAHVRAARAGEDFDGHQSTLPAVAGHALCVVRRSSDDAGHVGAVAVAVVGVRRPVENVAARDELRHEVRVRRRDSAVDDRDHDCRRAGRAVPGLRRLRLEASPLSAQQRAGPGREVGIVRDGSRSALPTRPLPRSRAVTAAPVRYAQRPPIAWGLRPRECSAPGESSGRARRFHVAQRLPGAKSSPARSERAGGTRRSRSAASSRPAPCRRQSRRRAERRNAAAIERRIGVRAALVDTTRSFQCLGRAGDRAAAGRLLAQASLSRALSA